MSTKATVYFVCFSFLVGLLLVALADGCKPAEVPDAQREIARGAVRVAVDAVQAIDVECAAIVKAHKDRELGEQCDAIYTETRAALIGAGIAVDGWGDVDNRRDLTCTIVDVGRKLALLSREIVGKGGRILPIAEDAVMLINRLGECKNYEGGAP